jgi:hypothetical protein
LTPHHDAAMLQGAASSSIDPASKKKNKKIDGAGGMAVAVTFRVFSAKHCLTEFYLKA